jgi:glycosyltransferase involved in cell wall biosynthesis
MTEQNTGGKTAPDLWLGLSPGINYGWGLACSYLAREIIKRVPDARIISSNPPEPRHFPGKFFHVIKSYLLEPLMENARGDQNYGYVFFEQDLPPETAENAKKYDIVFTGSTWCLERLADIGVTNTSNLIQGVDSAIFYPRPERTDFNHLFILFSGGKYELRKGQDIVMAAFKILSERHDDIALVNCWDNYLPSSIMTMKKSPLIKFAEEGGNWYEFLDAQFRANDISRSKLITVGTTPNHMIPEIIARSDLGIFPNRCEGGTNLVLMEYMACGKPAIVSNWSGHTDVATPQNSLLLEKLHDFKFQYDGWNTTASWKSPDLDELVDKIEYAYQHRDEIKKLGAQAAEDMKKFTWGGCAEKFLRDIGM